MSDDEDLRAHFNGELMLGHGIRGPSPFYLSLEDLKETSVHVLGASGTGKSFWIRNLIDQFLIHRQAFGIIDPHRGELVDYALSRLRRAGVPPKDIVLIDPSDGRYAVGFNPLACGISDAGETTGLVLDAFLKAWGAESFDSTPRLEGVLRGVIRTLAENKLTLLDSYEFLNVDNASLRRALLAQVPDRFVQQDWAEYEKLAKPDRLALFESTRNRLRRLLHAAPLQHMFAQTQNTLDFRRLLDEGKFLLVNLGGVAAPETQRLLGALIVNGIYHAAKLRDSRRRRDWYLLCDEFGSYCSTDFIGALTELRKFGAHVLMAHQYLAQLDDEDRGLAAAVTTNARIKVVFGGLSRDDAERMARELFTGQVHGNRVKHVAVQTKFRPIDEVFTTETESWSDGDSDSDSRGRSEGRTTNDFDVDHSGSSTSTESETRSRGSTWSHGHSRSQVPITLHEEFEEETGRQFYSLDEEWEKRIARIHGLPVRHALIKVYNRPVVHIVTPDVEGDQRDERLDRFQNKVMVECPYVKPVNVVVKQIEERRQALALLTEKTKTGDRPMDVKSFRE